MTTKGCFHCNSRCHCIQRIMVIANPPENRADFCIFGRLSTRIYVGAPNSGQMGKLTLMASENRTGTAAIVETLNQSKTTKG